MVTELTVSSSTSKLNALARLGRIIAYRELLLNLIRRELRAKYKESFLGFTWSMLNPMVYFAVFYVVFKYFLPVRVPFFAVYLLSGLLPWTFFASAISSAAGSLVGNSALLKKVSFPREVLPLASIGAALFHFFLQMLVLIAFLLIFRFDFFSPYLILVPIALLVEIALLIGLGLLLSAITVFLRDVQHLLELLLLMWFWLTPIIYQIRLVFDRLQARGLFGIYLLNPMTTVVLSFQRAFYNRVAPLQDGVPTPVLLDVPMAWYLKNLGLVGAAALLLILLGQVVFARLEGSFAEEL